MKIGNVLSKGPLYKYARQCRYYPVETRTNILEDLKIVAKLQRTIWYCFTYNQWLKATEAPIAPGDW